MRIVTYGEGGYDPTKPNDNIVETIEVPDPAPSPFDEARATIEAVRDPGQPTPSVQARLAALEALAVPPTMETAPE